MIKPINEIPHGVADKRKSYREMIRTDIQTAIDQGIDKFEFDGDYNWKYLAQYAREEADMIWRRKWTEIMRAAKAEHGFRYAGIPNYRDKTKYIKITTCKMPDRIHVYCQIDYDAPERICKAEIDKLLQEKAELRYRIESKDPTVRLYDVGLSYRTVNTLRKAGYYEVGDLDGKRPEDLAKIRDLGKQGIVEIMALKDRFGLSVGED